ncbi:hypothetical protein VD0004_g2817 [Verticillium dahliae]|nr:hypothetical protein VD0004_g2817 [Verticillium dahliae]
MAPNKPASVIEVLSDDDPAAERDATAQPSARALGKRKLVPDFEEKVVWDADSDDGLDLNVKKKRKAGARPKSKGTGKGKGKKVPKDEEAKEEEGEEAVAAAETDQRDDYEVAGAPDYLRERRRAFDSRREALREAGLLLPPDYADVDFSDDDDDAAAVPVRPQFDESAGVRPCRPCEDVELEYSGGVLPAPLARYLRDYQVAGVKFLHRLFVYQNGGVLGDDMGLGKTVQVAAFLTAAFGKTGDARDGKRMRKMRRDARRWYPRVLIICPGSLIENWKNELNRWGWWSIDLFHGSTAQKEDVLGAARAGMLEIMVTTYQTYKNHASSINTIQWDAVVADECHALKRGSAEITKAMNQINALCRIGLTGTAIQNNYTELWTLLNWTNPGHFGTAGEWDRTIAGPLRLGQSHDATFYQLRNARITAKKLVTNLLPGFFLRRMKSLIAHQLPKKSDRVVFCPLTEDQRAAYKRFIGQPEIELLRTLSHHCACGSGKKRGWCCDATVADGRSWQSIIFPSVTTLQKLANHLMLLVPPSTEPDDKQARQTKILRDCCPETWQELLSNRDAIMNLANPEFCGKWKVLKKLLKFWHENGDKVLVFSHSVRLLRILQHLFSNTSYNVTYLDGSLSYVERQRAVDDFNSDPGQFVFLISAKAGGVGLNITAANKVVIVDPHWNPSYDLQAQDRAYRIGQRRDVDVFRLVSSGTIEEIVYARQIYKQQQANIGYTASSERRYFQGVQEDENRKGEIFGLANLFTFRQDRLVIRDIVNKTNIAEARAGNGIAVSGMDMEQAANDEETTWMKREGPEGGSAEDGGMSQLASLLTARDADGAAVQPQQRSAKSDAIQAILSSAGVEYTHENSEVIGTSKIEEQLSRAAEMASQADNPDGNSALFGDQLLGRVMDARADGRLRRYRYNPPEDVMRRQFCSMAREFGFANATQFALVVENWTQEQRRNCLDAFYRVREGKLMAEESTSRERPSPERTSRASEAVKVETADQGGSPRLAEAQRELVEAEAARESSEVKTEGSCKVEAADTMVKTESSSAKRASVFIYDTDDDETDEL